MLFEQLHQSNPYLLHKFWINLLFLYKLFLRSLYMRMSKRLFYYFYSFALKKKLNTYSFLATTHEVFSCAHLLGCRRIRTNLKHLIIILETKNSTREINKCFLCLSCFRIWKHQLIKITISIKANSIIYYNLRTHWIVSIILNVNVVSVHAKAFKWRPHKWISHHKFHYVIYRVMRPLFVLLNVI